MAKDKHRFSYKDDSYHIPDGCREAVLCGFINVLIYSLNDYSMEGTRTVRGELTRRSGTPSSPPDMWRRSEIINAMNNA